VANGRSGLTSYAATARRVLVRKGVRELSARLRGGEERLVFVVGSPRSGTTFLAGAIGAVPGFADLTEVTPLKAAIPSLVGAEDAADRIRAILERVRMLALVRGVRGVEQTPETAFVLAAALAAYPEARAVHIVRDGRDVVCSLLERGWLSAGREGSDDALQSYGADARFWVSPDERAAFQEASDAARAAWAWRSYVGAARSVHERVLEIRYESLADAAPAIAAHLDVEAMPLAASLSRFRDNSIGRFRRDLSAEQLADVERVAGPLLRELGCMGPLENLIVHIAAGTDWDAAQPTTAYLPPRFEEEGFIHMSDPDQVHLPANALYSGRADLVLLWIDAERLEGELRYESAEQDGVQFPHLYGPLNLDAVVAVTRLAPWEPGAFVLPPAPL